MKTDPQQQRQDSVKLTFKSKALLLHAEDLHACSPWGEDFQ